MDNNLQALFVMGVARSGTSYLFRLLNHHPSICLSYESTLFTEGWHCYKRYSHLNRPEEFSCLLQDMISLQKKLGHNGWLVRAIQDNKTQLFHNHLAHASFAGLMEDIFLKAKPSARHFGNKMLRVEMCPDILAIWPDAKFVVLLRDPRAVVASQINRFAGRRLQYAAIYCDIHFKWIFQNVLHNPRYLVLTYEDFITNPHGELEKLLHFGGIPDTSLSRRMLSKSPTSTKSLHKWRNHLTAAQVKKIESYCYNSMKLAGYSLESDARPKKITALEKYIEWGFEKREALFFSPRIWKQKDILNRIKKIHRL